MAWTGSFVEALTLMRWIIKEERLRWIIKESRRRQNLKAENYCETYILSYPRSGNHAVRFALEFLSHRPTLGASDHESFLGPRGLHDLPIFLRGGASVKELRPIGIKRHRLKPIDRVSRLILIERDPVEAILSHTNWNGNASDDDLLAGYKWWSELRLNFEDFEKSHRLLIRFEDILDGNSDWIVELGEFIGLTPSTTEVDACARALPRSKKVVPRSPQTTSGTHYRHKFPQQAAVLDKMLETR